jgi:two-component system cell cycle sensor histidine kinase/response regulator CckA
MVRKMNKNIQVLFVEDSEEDVILLAKELERGGFKVTSKRVDTPESMVASLKEDKFDIILSDHTMPRFSAPAALQVLEQSGIDLPFVIVSGTLKTQTAVDIMRTGAKDYVDKGDLSRLVAIVEREIREAERRRTEEANFIISQQRFQTLANTSTDWVYWLSPDKEIVYISPSVFDITGYRPEEFRSNHDLFESIVHPGDKECFIKHQAEYTIPPMGNFNCEIEFRIIHKDGTVRWVSHKCGPITHENNNFLGRRISNRDITRRKLIESELEQKTAEAIASEQKATIYFDFLAHDMANILSPMMIYADIIKLKPDNAEEILKFINKTLEQVRRAAVLISNLRRLESIDKLHPNEMDVIDLRTLFSALEDNIRGDFPDKVIEISYDLPDVGSMAVKGGEWMQKVFHDIYDNAVRYSVNSPVNLYIKATMQQDGKERYWQIEISDNGPGIPNNLKKYYSNSIIDSVDGFKGVASSMPFCISFIRCIGGEMRIEDRIPGDPKQGTKITIRLLRGE